VKAYPVPGSDRVLLFFGACRAVPPGDVRNHSVAERVVPAAGRSVPSVGRSVPTDSRSVSAAGRSVPAASRPVPAAGRAPFPPVSRDILYRTELFP
jgi:hypothetical protein